MKDDNKEKSRNLLFLISRFLDGGIDTVLVEYLRELASWENFHITLGIGINCGELEVFRDRIPGNVKVLHFVNSPLLVRYYQKRMRHSIATSTKLLDELMINPVRRMMIKRKLKEVSRGQDAVIDFDCCAYSYLKGIHIPKIAYFHFSIRQCTSENPRRMRRISARFNRYDKIVTISQAMYQEALDLFPDIASRFTRIYNAVDMNAIEHKAEEIPEDSRIHRPYFLAVERLEESQKDIVNLLNAYKLLREHYQCTEKLYIIGKGNSFEMLREYTKKLSLSDDVCFLGFIKNPYPWIKHACCLLHSAKFEGLPTVLIEGLALDKLMVSTDCPTGPREILDNGKAGLLVPPHDPSAFAEGVHSLMTNASLRQSLLEGVKRQKVRFTFETTGKEFKKLIQ